MKKVNIHIDVPGHGSHLECLFFVHNITTAKMMIQNSVAIIITTITAMMVINEEILISSFVSFLITWMYPRLYFRVPFAMET